MEEIELSRHLPGAVGSLTAVFLMKDTWPRRIMLFIAGTAAAYYGTPWVSTHLNADHGLSGFLTGLFSMAISAKLFETIDAVRSSDLLDRVLKKFGV
jgi:hypothetical protein